MSGTLPETNMAPENGWTNMAPENGWTNMAPENGWTNMAPENGWLEYDRFLLGPGQFSGAFAVSFREWYTFTW